MTDHAEPSATTSEGARGAARLALVTGASSGIGRAFALRLGAQGYDIVAVGRRRDRLDELVAALPDVTVRPMVADLGAEAGVDAVAALCAGEPLDLLVNNAGVAHYMPFTDLPADKARELLHVKVVAPTMLARAAAPGMAARGTGSIVNVSGMLAFSGPASLKKLLLHRAIYTGALAHLVALSQALHEELKERGVVVQALCPGVVATEFHERQGLDLSKVPRMTADDVPGSLTLDRLDFMADAAIDSRGIAFIPDRAAAPGLADRRLVAVLEDWCPAIPGLFLYYPGHRQAPPALRAFIDVLREVLP